MKAVILAGGKGTRLYPYTTLFPKPLVPIDDLPIIEILLRQLKASGVTSVVISVGHLAELLVTFLGKGEKFGLAIDYVREDEPLGTVAPLTLIENLPENFLLMNGDILTSLDFRALFDFHVRQQNPLTVATYAKRVATDLGIVTAEPDGRIVAYAEKPVYTYHVSMGVYAFNKAVLRYIPAGGYFDFPSLVNVLLNQNVNVMAYPFEGIWLDIGRPADYEEAQRLFPSLRGTLWQDGGHR